MATAHDRPSGAISEQMVLTKSAPSDPILAYRQSATSAIDLRSLARVAGAHPELDALHIGRSSYPDAVSLRQLGLTKRQAEVLALATRGLSAQQIADLLVLSRRTVEKHFETIYAQLGVKTRARAIAATLATHAGAKATWTSPGYS